jgi:hypothetical protein
MTRRRPRVYPGAPDERGGDWDRIRAEDDSHLIAAAKTGVVWAHRLDRSPPGISDEISFVVERRLSVAGLRPPSSQKELARARVFRARRAGKLVAAPCDVCGAKKVEAHHVDYARPLDVRWLCRPCHLREHREQAA